MYETMPKWRCDICGELRSDDDIRFLSKTIHLDGIPDGSARQNVKYCNDKAACIGGAKTFEFFKQ